MKKALNGLQYRAISYRFMSAKEVKANLERLHELHPYVPEGYFLCTTSINGFLVWPNGYYEQTVCNVIWSN